MTRYFYTDPLAAAWMAKHFGMRFESGSISGFHCSVFSAGKNTPHYFADDGDDDFKGIIHPDSLPLLVARVGDMVTNIGARAWLVDRVEPERLWSGDLYTVSEDARILQRDGLPFMWPESEAA